EPGYVVLRLQGIQPVGLVLAPTHGERRLGVEAVGHHGVVLLDLSGPSNFRTRKPTGTPTHLLGTSSRRLRRPPDSPRRHLSTPPRSTNADLLVLDPCRRCRARVCGDGRGRRSRRGAPRARPALTP